MASRGIEQATLDLVEALEACETPGQVRSLFQQFIEGFGFSRTATLKVPEAGETLAQCLLMNTYPREWTAHYDEAGYVGHDPIVHELFYNTRPYSWAGVMERRDLSGLEQRVMDEASEFGMKGGFVVPIYEVNGQAGLVSVVGENQVIGEDMRNALTLAGIYVYNKLCSLRREQHSRGVALTRRERECLNWAAAGKSDWEIGQILSISSKTVNYHIENIKRKFGVATRIQAIVEALRQGKLIAP